MHRWRHLALTVIYILLIVGFAVSSPEKKDEKKPEKKNDEKPEEKKVDPNALQDRTLSLDVPIDQLAVESGPSYHAVAPAPYQGDHGGGAPYPEPIPVPLPLPVHPGSIVLPSLPFANKGGVIGGGYVGGGGHGGGFGDGGHGGGFGGGGHGGGFGGGGHGGGFGGGGHGGGGHGGGFDSGAGIPPPPIVHKQPHAPLTRSSNPSPVVSHGGGSASYQPPPPPPQLPPQGYGAPPPQNYIPPPQSAYSAPGDNYAPPPNEIYNAPSNPSQVYNAPQINAAPLVHHGDVDSRESFDHAHQSISNFHDSPVNNYQAPPQLGIPSGPGGDISGSAYAPPTSLIPDEPWTTSKPDLPTIVNINVKCEKNLMRVLIEFDRPFYGIIFSKGHYSNINCVHLPAGLGKISSTFDISINSCGTTGNTDSGQYSIGGKTGTGTYFENTLVIQYDPQVQEVWDQARKLRCTWHDQYEKSVTFKPFPVDMLDVVRADFAGDNVGCWMQIQVGKGPWASEVSGLVKIGQAMTMVLAIKDEDNKFDMLVRNCMAHDGKRAPIQLVDQRGCVTRPKLMSRFTKIKNFGASASVLSYAHFQAFKFPDSMEVHFQCTIQICRFQCPEQCSDSIGLEQPGSAFDVPAGIGSGPYRRKRAVNTTDDNGEKDIGVNRIIQVVSTRDLGFLIDKKELVKEIKESERGTLISSIEEDSLGLICMSTPGFAATLVVLLSILVISCLLSAFLCLRYRGNVDTKSIISSYQNPAFLHKKRFF